MPCVPLPFSVRLTSEDLGLKRRELEPSRGWSRPGRQRDGLGLKRREQEPGRGRSRPGRRGGLGLVRRELARGRGRNGGERNDAPARHTRDRVNLTQCDLVHESR